MAPESIDRAGGQRPEFRGTAQGFERLTVTRQHQRNGLWRDLERRGNLAVGITQPPQHRNVPHPFGHLVKQGKLGPAGLGRRVMETVG